MKIESILVRDNVLMDSGNINQQIIVDLEEYIDRRKRYQTEHLDKKIKGTPHYNEWTKDNQDLIKYVERILECVKAGGVNE